jgi:hypothetical protein
MSAKKKKTVFCFKTEKERYLEAARLVFETRMSTPEAIRETGIYIPSFLEVSKQTAWPIRDNWSEEFKLQSRIEKLILMSEIVAP